ncbi:hypothetical protein VU01_13032 [Candidatus Electrothrix marina]|uniref:Uncharacterized protein n=1 Tax=Candidatus Electrothrix marina TaxID=1859130 RepID=A0A3S3R2C0_9BACT|nr:hypothetical protein VT99_10964 [Candidatus Electrothrix marina]RWX50538.1 hypothetical protein VU01_13032 [Candidatus Electrothrix marina]
MPAHGKDHPAFSPFQVFTLECVFPIRKRIVRDNIHDVPQRIAPFLHPFLGVFAQDNASPAALNVGKQIFQFALG